MDFIIDFVSVDNADAIVVWIKKEGQDYVLFIDGGKTGDGNKVIEHYDTFIAPYVFNPAIVVVNSHPHNDHINGMIEIVNHFKEKIASAVYNDPLLHIPQQKQQQILEERQKDEDINHLYETLEKVKTLNELCKKYGINQVPAFSDDGGNYWNLFQIVSPSVAFYKERVEYFTNLDVLLKEDFTKKGDAEVNEAVEGVIACEVVDEKNDASPENLTSTVIKLTDSQGRNFILTADAGVASFDSAIENGFNLTDNNLLVQLPHHGSRRNVNTNWICKFNPAFYVASAAGTKKHPRKAVIACIKKNLPNCRAYSTHKTGTLSYTTNQALFPYRGWGAAQPL